MFPDLGPPAPDKPLVAKAFEVLAKSPGTGVCSHQVTFRPDGWDAGTTCDNYRDFNGLNMARRALATALAAMT